MDKKFTLADLVDYEVQLNRLQQGHAENLAELVIKQGKIVSLKSWLVKVRGPHGKHFSQLIGLLSMLSVAIGVLLGWATIQLLLTNDSSQPVNIFHYFVFFVAVPALFLLALFGQNFIAKVFARIPKGWIFYTWQWVVTRVAKLDSLPSHANEIWKRLADLHSRLFTLEAWAISQSFALAYYVSSLVSLLLLLTVNDYAFGWQTTLQIGPNALLAVVDCLALPFAWLGSFSTPNLEVIQSTQFDRFSGQFIHPSGPDLAGHWWPFLVLLITFYGCLPRLLLLIFFRYAVNRHLGKLSFDDFASEKLWLHLQRTALGWETKEATPIDGQGSVQPTINMHLGKTFVVVRWRQAPLQDVMLQEYFMNLGIKISTIIDAEGRDSEIQTILDSMSGDLALALVCDSWELPGESFNRLRLAVRAGISVRTPILLVPMSQAVKDKVNKELWEASINAFRDPYLGLIQEGKLPT